MENNMQNTLKQDFKEEIKNILESNSAGVHSFIITEELSKKIPDFEKIFTYGFNKLSEINKLPDIFLASFFFCLTALKGIPKIADDWATDAMIFCKNTEDFPVPSTKKKLIEIYTKKVHPLLKK